MRYQFHNILVLIAHIPYSGRDIELGFDDIEKYPEGFVGQSIEPFRTK